jgi:hypothetical protein
MGLVKRLLKTAELQGGMRVLSCRLLFVLAIALCAVSAWPGVAFADITTNLIVHLKFDQSSSATLVDSTGNGNDITTGNQNALTFGTTGYRSYAGSFNGTSTYANVPDNSSGTKIDDVTGSWTIGAWVYATSTPGGYVAIASRQSGTGSGEHYHFGFSSGNFEALTNGGSCVSNVTITTNQWVHYAAVYNTTADTMVLYVNGRAIYSCTVTTGDPAADSRPLTIGSNNNGNPSYGEFFPGRVDEFRLYNRALSAGDIVEMAEGSMPIGGAPKFYLGGTNNVSCTTCWSKTAGGATDNAAPTSSDRLMFATSTSGTLTLNSTATYNGIDMQTPASGSSGSTVTPSAATTITLNNNFTQAAGTFTGTSGTLDIIGDFNVTGGTHTAMSGTTKVNGSLTMSGATFSANTGSFVMAGNANQTLTATGYSFYNLTFGAATTGLAHHWKYDNAMTDTVGGWTGTLTGNATYSSASVPTVGFTDSHVLTLDGTGDYVSYGANDLNPILGTTSSLSAWFKTSDTGPVPSSFWQAPAITGTEAGGSADIFWGWLDNAGKLGLKAGDGVGVQSATAVNNGAWHHVVMTRDATTGREMIYIDGALSGVATGDTGPASYAFYSVGRSENSGDYWLGELDDVRVFSREISGLEAYRLYTGVDAGGPTYTLGSNIDVDGAITLTKGTVSGSSHTMTVAGNWVNNGGTFTAGTCTVNFDGTATGKTITSNSGSFYNVTVSGSGGAWTAQDAFDATGALAVSNGTIALSSYAASVGSVNQTGGTLTATSGLMTVGGAFVSSAGTFTHNSGTVLMKSTSSVGVPAVTFNTLYLNDGLVGYWKFDETSGTTAADASGFGNTMSNNGTPVQSSTIPTLNYKNVRSLQFDGSNSVINSSPVAFPTAQGAQTISMWVYYTAVPVDARSFYTAWNGSNVATQFGFRASALVVGKFGGTVLVTTTPPSTSTWHHILYTNDGSNNQALWVDGVRANTSTTAPDSGAYTSVNIGATSGSFESVTAFVDEARVYTRKLSDDEIRSLASGSGPGTTQSTYTAAGATTVNGDLNLPSGKLDISAAGMTVKGSFYNNGGLVSAGTQTLTFSGTASSKYIQTNGSRLGAVTVSGASGGWTLLDPLEATGALTITNGTLASGGYLMRVGNLAHSAGTFTPSSNSLVLLGSTSANSTFQTSATLYNLRVENPAASGLLGYWKMDEGVGSSVVDWTGNGRTGTRTGGMWSTTVPSSIGFPDRYSFNTQSGTGYVQVPYNAALNPTDISVSLWVKQSADGPGTVCNAEASSWIFLFPNTRGNSGNFEGFGLKDLTGWGLQGMMTDNSAADAEYITEGIDFTVDSNWHHLVLTFDDAANSFLLYRDGVVTAGAAGNHTTSFNFDPARSLFIGRNGQCGSGSDYNGDGYFRGSIDDFRVYNRALTSTEVKALYAGNYPSGSTTYSTQVSGTVGVSNTLAIDSGKLDVSTGTLNATLTSAQAKINGGTLSTGTGTTTLSGGAFVKSGGVIDFPSTGTLNIATGKTLNLDGTLSATAGAVGTLQGSGGSFTFTVNSDTSNPYAVIDVDGLNIKYTDTSGMNIAKATSTTFTKLQNVNFTNGTGARYLYINADSLNVSMPGITFDLGAGARTTTNNVVVAGTGSRYYFEDRGTSTSGIGAGEAYDSDNDATADGLADSSGSVVQWVWGAKTDLAGSITGFPTAAFDWSNFSYYSSYVAMKDIDGSGTDRIYVRSTSGDAAYSWDLPTGKGDIIGTPRWDTISSVHYVYVSTTGGYVYKLVDNGTTLALAGSPWDTPYNQGTNATVTSPLLTDANYVYWAGNNTSSNPTLFRLSNASKGTATTQSLTAAVNAAMALDTPSASAYVMAATLGHLYRYDATNNSAPTDSTTLNPAAIDGRISVLYNVLYAVDNAGKLNVVPTTTLGTATWTYQDTSTHGSCSSGNNCQAKNLYVSAEDYLNTGGKLRVVYGDKDGHVYIVRQNGATSAGVAMTGYPLQPNSDTNPIVTSALYQSGILVVGNSNGKVYVINAFTATGPSVPSLVQTYDFGSGVSIASIARNRATNSNAGAYLVATSNGKLFYIPTTTDGDAYP